jgi:nucleotide-binding universal stress UspA family protein
MKILIAYDGSECSDTELEDLQRAGLPPQNVEALVMSMADVFLPGNGENDDAYVPEAVKRARERAQQKLDEAKALAESASRRIKALFPSWQVRSDALADSPAWALIRTAEEWKPDLILMGARGQSFFGGRLILGSISQRVLYEANCSVRIARSSGKDTDAPLRLLAGVDRSPDSTAAIDAICNRTWPKGTEAGVLAVVDTVMAINPEETDPLAMKWIEVGEEKNWDQVREIFEPVAEKLRRAGLHAEILIRRGNPADEILEEADTWGADCIFVGAKGTRGIDRLLLGSVSSAVSARAHCSVEVVRR